MRVKWSVLCALECQFSSRVYHDSLNLVLLLGPLVILDGFQILRFSRCYLTCAIIPQSQTAVLLILCPS
jgi:hypothetical protein